MSTHFPSVDTFWVLDVDTSNSGVDTSSLHTSVKTHCLQVSTLPVSGVDTWLSVFKEFGYCSQVSTLTLPGVDTYHLILWSLATDLRCQHFFPKCWHFSSIFMKFCHWSQVLTLLHQVSALLVCLHEFWLLISGVDTLISQIWILVFWLQVSTPLVLSVDTLFSRSKSLATNFRCQHFYVGCRHLSLECISLNSLLI